MSEYKVDEYTSIGKVGVLTDGIAKLFFRKPIVPNEHVTTMVENFILNEKKKHNAILAESFNLPEGGFTKYEFFSFDEKLQPASGTSSDDHQIMYQFPKVFTSTIYVLENSVISYDTTYRIQIWKKIGCSLVDSGEASVMVYGGKTYRADQYYYKHIQAVSIKHSEDTYKAVNVSQGCNGQTEEISVKREQEVMVLRASENFEAYAFKNQASELRECRKLINNKLNALNS